MKLRKQMKNSQGITLVALVVTIIVLLILAGITMKYTSNQSISVQAHEVNFKSRWISYKEEVDTYTTWSIAKNMNADINKINAGETLTRLIENNVITDINLEDIQDSMNKIIGRIDESDKKYLVVYHGELCYVKDSSNKNAEREEKWSRELEIPVLILK